MPKKSSLSQREVEEMFRSDREARIAFFSSAMANFPPQQEKYSSPKKFAVEINDFAEAAADEALKRLHEWEEDWEPDLLDEEEEEEEEEEEDDDEPEEEEDDDEDARPRRRRA